MLAMLEAVVTDGWWLCPACGQRLGRIVDGQLQILHDGRYVVVTAGRVTQTCHREHCRTVSEWTAK